MEELIVRSKDGDEKAFTELILSMQNDLYRIGKTRLSDDNDISDAIQETMISAYKHIKDLKDISTFKSWIIKILINECNKIHKRKSKKIKLFEKLANEETSNIIDDSINLVNSKIDFEQLISKLNDEEQLTITLYYDSQYSCGEIADILNMNINTVKSKLTRAKKKIKNYHKGDKFNKKTIILIISIFTITSGIVLAKDINNLFKNLIQNIFGNYNNGITRAVENGYIQDIDMQYIESNNIKAKVDHITLDDYNLGIVFNIQFNVDLQLDNLNNLYDVKFKNLLIMDENNNVLFAEYENQEDFVKYCKENNLDKGTYGIGYANCGSNGKILNMQDNNIIYSFYTTSDKFPVSKNLKIKFDKIALLNGNFTEDNAMMFEGDWKINISLDEMQKDRKTIEYYVININDKKTTVEKASLSMSNMKLELITNSNKIDFKKLQSKEKLNVVDMIPFHELYIETSNGKRFFQSNDGNNGYDTVGNNKIRYYTNFDYTYFDKSEIIKIVLPTNKKQDLIIEMKANNFEAQ